MKRALIGGGIALLAYGIATAQTRDPRVDELTKETAQLKRAIADQNLRIAQLEKIVGVLQGAAVPPAARIPPDTPPWHLASSWSLIRKGMSEAQIVEILGPATNVQSAIDTRTMFYTTDARSATALSGSVTLIDDRVAASAPPNIKPLPGTAGAGPPRIPSETPAWRLSSNWNLIRKGMAEAQVVEILGPPTSVQSVTDVRVLHYQSDSRTATILNGTVTLTDDRVTASAPPRL